MRDIPQRSPRTVRRAAGEWIGQRADWNWYATLTFRYALPVALAQRVFLAWLRVLAHRANAHVPTAYCRELQRRNVDHYHALIDYPAVLPDPQSAALGWGDEFRPTSESLLWLWRAGHDAAGPIGRIEPVRNARDVGRYLAKYEDWALRLACPSSACRRQGSCVVAKITGW